jgi:hypothetical protein
MSVLVDSFGEFLQLMFNAFNLSTSFPALILVLLIQIFLLPVLPQDNPFAHAYESLGDFGKVSMSLVITAIIAYVLDAANSYIIKFFEGYWFRSSFPFSWLEGRHRNHATSTWNDIRKLEKLADALIAEAKQMTDRQRRNDFLDLAEWLVERKSSLQKQVESKYPMNSKAVLPTSFGNVVASAEEYPKTVFGMDAITLWPFLVPTLAKEDYAKYVAREKTTVDFLLNVDVVLGVFASLVLFTHFITAGFVLTVGLVAMLASLVVVASIFYMLAIQAAAGWGLSIKTAFVLFRDELRTVLGLRRAKDHTEERVLWSSTSEFLRAQAMDEKLLVCGKSIFSPTLYEQSETTKRKWPCQRNQKA